MKPLKIVRLTYVSYPDTIGGHTIYIHELSRRQAIEGHKIVVVTRKKKGMGSHLRLSGYDVIRLPKATLPWDLVVDNPFLLGLGSLLESIGPDIIECHDYRFISGLEVKWNADVPLIIFVHGMGVKRNIIFDSLQSAYLHSAGRLFLRRADATIVLTEADRRSLLGLGVDPEKVRLVPQPVDTGTFRPSPEIYDPSNYKLLWIGRFVPEKGPDLLAAVSKALMLADERIELHVVGEGQLLSGFSKVMSESHLAPRVVYHGLISQESVADLMRECALLLLTSRQEGFPRVIAEAMASGLPFVAFELPGLLRTGGGLLAVPFDVSSFTDLALAVLRDARRRHELGAEGRAIAEKTFSWELSMEKIYSTYAENLRA